MGWQLQQQLADLKVFLVGAGALGCEFLKNFALMGIGTGPKGQVRLMIVVLIVGVGFRPRQLPIRRVADELSD